MGVCVHIRTCRYYMWMLEGNLRCCSLGDIYIIFETVSLVGTCGFLIRLCRLASRPRFHLSPPPIFLSAMIASFAMAPAQSPRTRRLHHVDRSEEAVDEDHSPAQGSSVLFFFFPSLSFSLSFYFPFEARFLCVA